MRGLRAGVAALALVLAPLAAPAQSLSDTLVLAYDTSDLLSQQRNLLAALDEDVAQAVAALRPTLSYFANVSARDDTVNGTSSTGSLGLLLQWTLMDGGRRAFQIGAAKESVLAARWRLQNLEQQVLLDAVTAYFGLRLAVQVVDVSENNLRLLTQQLRAARDRFEVGEVTRTDVAIAQTRLAASESQLAAARGQVDIAREQYRLATGHAPEGVLPAPPPTPELPPTVERTQALAVQIHPSIKALQHDIAAAELFVQLARAQRLPTIDLSGQAQRSEPDTQSLSITLGAQGPLYTGGNLASLGRQARANANAARAGLAQQGRVISDAVGRAFAQLQIARAQIIASDQQVRSAQLAFEGFREEAALGARTTLDVLDAEQELLDARFGLIEAQSNAQLAVYQVLAAAGLLTVDHLGLAVQRFDPDVYYNAVRTAPATVPRTSERGGRLDRVLRRFGRN
ncbi:TolC family outer membrane protein [Jannaschia sp. W003]|uniref:TolC family outer membrane protein n=1 Tax=Jannaschia sp. W003 TaxID=2867012 RepID=UPI0021A8B25C|nr:TolC family outer membrane protein [Jannaschia sp. W003]UWQ20195.1 TolC family outer membrane protein [Jannaschia sp. W003]